VKCDLLGVMIKHLSVERDMVDGLPIMELLENLTLTYEDDSDEAKILERSARVGQQS
jgi:hypothetical protein